MNTSHCHGLRAAALALGFTGLILAMQPAQATSEVARGEQVYVRCIACHALTYDRVGPRHCGLLGRHAGSIADFTYTPAMKNSGLIWDEKTLDRFLAQPIAVVPGTAMTYDGVSDPLERSDLIAYLKAANNAPPCKP